MFSIYDSDYDEMPEDHPFGSINEAAMYIMADLPHEDFLYLIGTGDGINAVVFQGQVYYPEASLAGILRARAEAAEAEVARLREWIVDACNYDHSLMPPSDVEIGHKVKPWPSASWQPATANSGQDAAGG